MNRALLATLVGFGALLSVGAAVALFLGDEGGDERTACEVAVYLTATATPAQIDAIRAQLASDSKVVSFAYLSKEAALARLKKRYPELVAGLTYNPLPAKFEVIAEREEDRRALVEELSGVAGVDDVRSCPESHSISIP